MIEKWNYLYLFIIHDANVIKYLCLSFSMFASLILLWLFHCEIFYNLLYIRTLLRLCDKSRVQRMQNGWEEKPAKYKQVIDWFSRSRLVIDIPEVGFLVVDHKLKLLITCSLNCCLCWLNVSTFNKLSKINSSSRVIFEFLRETGKVLLLRL